MELDDVVPRSCSEDRGRGSRVTPAYRARCYAIWSSCLLLVLGGIVVFGAACGGGGQRDSAYGTVLTVEQVLAAKPGEPISVTGAIVATGSGADMQMVLASVLLESYPPQAGGAMLPVAGLDSASLVGLSSTVGRPDLSPVTWSDYWLTMHGVIRNGTLEVQGVPQVAEASSGDLRVRFSPVSEPLTADGTAVWWAFDIQNMGAGAADLTFSSGQRADVVLSQDGVEKYRWSADKVFTQALETVTVASGEILPIVLNDELMVEAGRYDLRATIVAAVGPDGAEPSLLPELNLTVTVY